MLYRLLALWICLMMTSLHAVGGRVIAMAKSIEGRTKATYSDDKVYSIVADLPSTLTTAYNAECEEVGCIGSI